MSLWEKQWLFVQNVTKLLEYIKQENYSCTFGEAWRPPEMAAIYAKNGKGITHSLHCDRLAIDLNIKSPDGDLLTKSEDYAKFGVFWKKLNPMNKWGGDFQSRPDGNHFSLSDDGKRG